MDKALADVLVVAAMTVSWMLTVHGCKVRYFATAVPDIPVDAPLIRLVAEEHHVRRSEHLFWFVGVIFVSVCMIVQLAALVCLDVYYNLQIGVYVFTALATNLYASYVHNRYGELLPELTTLKRMIELRE